MQKRTVFVFGTLYDEEIIKALLGTVPRSFESQLNGYSVYKGVGDQVPSKIINELEKNHDMKKFVYLFAKKDDDLAAVISGKAYELDLDQELILDSWERYPFWYRKESVTIKDEKGNEHDAFVYSIDKKGEKMTTFDRVPYDRSAIIDGASKVRKEVLKEFSSIE